MQLCKKYPSHRYFVVYDYAVETYTRRFRNRYSLGRLLVIPTMDKGALGVCPTWAMLVLHSHVLTSPPPATPDTSYLRHYVPDHPDDIHSPEWIKSDSNRYGAASPVLLPVDCLEHALVCPRARDIMHQRPAPLSPLPFSLTFVGILLCRADQDA